jgi:predicted RNA-binding protein
MCEFKVLKNNELVFEDAVYAKAEGNKVTVRDVLGMSKVIENCTITEVDVNKERLTLTPSK